MSTEQHVIVTQEQRPGKAPLIHVYGGYTDRPTAQRGARAFISRLFPFEQRNWRATTHKVQYDRGLGGVTPVIEENRKAFEEFGAPKDEKPQWELQSASVTKIVQGVPKWWRFVALVELALILGVALAVTVAFVPWGR